MNPSKRRVKCSDCGEMKDSEEVVCKDCVERIRDENYNSGYHDGEKDGYKEGMAEGEKKGQEEGFRDGYTEAMEVASRKLDDVLSKLKR